MKMEDWFRQTDSPRAAPTVTNPTWTGLDSKRSLRVERTKINRLVHGTVLVCGTAVLNNIYVVKRL
jgi:hypothetical protein